MLHPRYIIQLFVKQLVFFMIDQFMLDGGWKSQLYPIDVLGDERAQFFTTVKTEQLNFGFEYVLSLSVFSQALV